MGLQPFQDVLDRLDDPFSLQEGPPVGNKDALNSELPSDQCSAALELGKFQTRSQQSNDGSELGFILECSRAAPSECGCFSESGIGASQIETGLEQSMVAIASIYASEQSRQSAVSCACFITGPGSRPAEAAPGPRRPCGSRGTRKEAAPPGPAHLTGQHLAACQLAQVVLPERGPAAHQIQDHVRSAHLAQAKGGRQSGAQIGIRPGSEGSSHTSWGGLLPHPGWSSPWTPEGPRVYSPTRSPLLNVPVHVPGLLPTIGSSLLLGLFAISSAVTSVHSNLFPAFRRVGYGPAIIISSR